MCKYKDDVPSFQIRDGNMVIEWADGSRMCIPMRVFRINMAAAAQAIAEHDATNATVIPFIGKAQTGNHAATA